MRLLNTRSWDMREFVSQDEMEPYAILSHTWQEEEISFQQWEGRKTSDISHLKGYKKIISFGKEAANNGFDWVWVDTCCIDKKSSAELTEAINAMFRWYRNAVICYVYLADCVRMTGRKIGLRNDSTTEKRLRRCRWFTRGWTLQELIAPRQADFYSADWHRLASKHDMRSALSAITGIDEDVLCGAHPPAEVSIARRMSWASKRRTSRVEDIAYCLLGLFDINMPLIYGEGTNAFQRLQEEIMRRSHDQSLFAWGRVVPQPADILDQEQIFGLRPIAWKPPAERQPLLGLLAASPADFVDSADIRPVNNRYAHEVGRRNPPAVVNGGVLIDLVICSAKEAAMYWDYPARLAISAKLEIALLLCHSGRDSGWLVGISLRQCGNGYYARSGPQLVHVNEVVNNRTFPKLTQRRHLLPARPFALRDGDIVLRRRWSSWECERVYIMPSESEQAWREDYNGRVLRLHPDARGNEYFSYILRKREGKTKNGADDGDRLAFTLRRKRPPLEDKSDGGSGSRGALGPLMVGVTPLASENDDLDWHTLKPTHGGSSSEPAFSHVMRTPIDRWECEIDRLPCVYVRVERMPLEEGKPEAVDVVDLFIYPKGTPEADLAKVFINSVP